jgi:two-component system sensor histidine kinase KdpD
VARGLSEAMGGTLIAEDTPGGGLTMVVSLAAATVPDPSSLPDAVADPAPAPVRAP